MTGWGKFGWLAGGFLIGTAGLKILGSSDMKKAYTHCTAAVLRMSDQVVKDFTVIGENASDIAADAKEINEKRAQEREKQMVEDARAVVAKADVKEGKAKA